MDRYPTRYLLVCWSLALLLLGGCGTTAPTRFYVLTAVPDAQQMHPRADELAIGVGPVEVPGYLDRPQIVTWTGQQELHLAEFDHWAEPLQQNVTRVLAENLSSLLATDRVALYPWSRSVQLTYQVVVRLTRFETTVGKQSVLTAWWQILDVSQDRELMQKTSHLEVPIQASDYGAIVAALSRSLGDLSREIAVQLRTLAQKTAAR